METRLDGAPCVWSHTTPTILRLRRAMAHLLTAAKSIYNNGVPPFQTVYEEPLVTSYSERDKTGIWNTQYDNMSLFAG